MLKGNYSNYIEKTTDYDRFRLLGSNRTVNPVTVKNLVTAMRKRYLPVPILVNEKWEVIDGQHRLAACRELGLPVYYQLVKGLTEKDCVSLNANQRAWTTTDYLNHYASRGSGPAKRFLAIVRDYKLPFKAAAALAPNLSEVSAKRLSQHDDRWFDESTFSEGDYIKAREMADKISGIIRTLRVFGEVNTRSITQSLAECFYDSLCDQDRVIKCITDNAETFIPTLNKKGILIQVAKLYNKRRRADFMDVLPTSNGSWKPVFNGEVNRWKS